MPANSPRAPASPLPKGKTRVAARRRPPEAARREILEAAMRVFRHHHPDEVGLKEVAREAGVSHALITHYFGSFGGLCDAALELRVVALRELMIARMSLAGGLDRPGELLATLFEALEDPVHRRLWMWALATERTAAQDFFPLRHQGLRLVAERVASSIAAATGADASAILPETERILLAGVAAAYGYTIGRQALIGALGKQPSRELDRALQDSLGEMMREHLLRHAERQAGQAAAKGRRGSSKRRAGK
jgi:TetR/AcrR family transcriptional regulator, repressor for neighboring sulfatase